MSSLLRRLTVTFGRVQPNAAVSVKFAQQYDTLVAFRDAEMRFETTAVPTCAIRE